MGPKRQRTSAVGIAAPLPATAPMLKTLTRQKAESFAQAAAAPTMWSPEKLAESTFNAHNVYYVKLILWVCFQLII